MSKKCIFFCSEIKGVSLPSHQVCQIFVEKSKWSLKSALCDF